MIDTINEIRQALGNNKGRTVLTGIAVAWGIFMLIVLLGMSNAVVNSFKEDRRNQGSNMLKIWGGTTSEAWHGYKEGRTIELRTGDMERISNDNPKQAANVTAKIRGNSATISTTRDYMTSSWEGVYPAEARQRALEMAYGRYINDLDVSERRKVIVLSTQSAETLFGNPANAVGNTVKVGDLIFKVVGVYATDWDRSVYIPFSTAQVLAANGDIVSELNIDLQNVNSVADGTEAETKARQTLAASHDFKPDDSSAVDVWNRFNQQMSMNMATNILNYAVWVIGLFTLLSGIVGVSNIMFVSVRERTHEIGIRRAIGAKPRSILTQIILESVAITTLFGYIGIVLGTVVIGIIAKVAENVDFLSDPSIDLNIALAVTIILIIAGIGAGLFPALKALNVKPVEALRDE